jgi:RHS repeat-associated protein
VTPSGTLIKYYSADGLNLGLNTTTSASGISYLADDGLGSVSEALNQTGTATGSVLYGPYGSVRYTSGTMPTAKGFTGQYADAATGLDYYGARYYDPALGQFSSADTVTDGLNRFGYVKGNPETFSDPSGHRCFTGDGGVCGGPGSSPPPPPPPTSGGSGTGGHSSGNGGGSGKTCNPDSAGASDACKARAYDNNKYRDDKLRDLQTSAYLKQIAGYLLLIFADAVDIIRGTTLAKLEALLDLGTTIFNSLLPLLGQVVQNLIPQFHDVYQQMLHFGSALNGVLGAVRAAIGFVKQGNWLMQASISVALQIATNAEAPVPSVLFTLAASFFGPALTNYMDSGAHELIRSGLDDQAEWQRQKDMNIVDWCVQYGGGGCADFPDH